MRNQIHRKPKQTAVEQRTTEPEREGYLVDAANGCGAKRWWLSRVAANLGSEDATVIAGSGFFTNPFVYVYLRIATGSCGIAQ